MKYGDNMVKSLVEPWVKSLVKSHSWIHLGHFGTMGWCLILGWSWTPAPGSQWSLGAVECDGIWAARGISVETWIMRWFRWCSGLVHYCTGTICIYLHLFACFSCTCEFVVEGDTLKPNVFPSHFPCPKSTFWRTTACALKYGLCECWLHGKGLRLEVSCRHML